MTALYHINPETGRPGQCTASVQDCKYAVDGKTLEHYNSLDDALDAYENQNKDKTIQSLQKPKKAEQTVIEAEIVDDTLSIDDDMVDEEESTKLSAPKPLEYQPAAAVEIIEPEKALTIVDDISAAKYAALEKKSSTWTENIASMNPHSQEFMDQTRAINKIAGKAFKNTAELSQSFLNNNSLSKPSASDQIGKKIVQLRNVMEDMAPKEDTFKSKALSFLPGRNAVKNYFNRFESNAKNMNVIMESLNKGQAMLHQESAELNIERQQLWNNLGTLQEAEGLLKSMDEKVVEKIGEEKANGNAQMAKALEQNVLFNIRQRRQDVGTQTAVTVQSYMAMGMIEENNVKLMQNIERTKTTTTTALVTAARINQALGGQKKILDGIDEMKNMANNIMLDNAKQLQQNTLKIQEQASSSSVDTGVLKESFDRMFETMDQMDQFRSEANNNFLTTIDALSAQVDRANQYAKTRNQNNNQIAGNNKLSIED